MGMFDSFFDAKGNDWQTKAFGRTLEQWEVGSEIPGAHPLPFQAEVLGGEINEPGDFVESFVTIIDQRVVSVPAERDESLPLLRMGGGWAPASDLDGWEWGVARKRFPDAPAYTQRDLASCERFIAHPPMNIPDPKGPWFIMRRRRAGSWTAAPTTSDSSSTGGEL